MVILLESIYFRKEWKEYTFQKSGTGNPSPIYIYIYIYKYIYIYVYRTGVSGYHNFDKNMLSILSESMESICFPKFWYPETPVLYTYTYIYMYIGLGFSGTTILERICFPYFRKVWKAYAFQNSGTRKPQSYIHIHIYICI